MWPGQEWVKAGHSWQPGDCLGNSLRTRPVTQLERGPGTPAARGADGLGPGGLQKALPCHAARPLGPGQSAPGAFGPRRHSSHHRSLLDKFTFL